MASLPRARERVRPWPARAPLVLAVAGLLSFAALIGHPQAALAPASAKSWKKQQLASPQAPVVQTPAGTAGKGHPAHPKPANAKGPKGEKAQLPELPKVELPSLKAPKVEAPATSGAEPARVVQPAPAPAAPSAEAPRPSTSRRPATRRPATSRRAGRPAPGRSRSRPAARRAHRSVEPGHPARRRSHRSPAASATPRHKRGPAARPRRSPRHQSEPGSAVTRTVREIVKVVPRSIKAALAALACLSAVLGGGYLLSLLRARRLDRQRGELLQEVGLLQAALLPPVPDTLGAVRPSVAYRPAEGLAAGGDFYDALELPGGRAAFVLGDVSGHGHEALERTAFVRYTLRAFLEAGLEPRAALQVAARVVGDHMGGEFVTVLLAVHDPGTASLTWASAGHPAPIVLGPEPFHPVTTASAPPIGMGLESGFRQTTVSLPAGAVACLFTDGLVEARTNGDFVGRRGLERLLGDLGPEATAADLIEMVAATSRAASDDMAACLVRPAADAPGGAVRREELVASAEDLDSGLAARFLAACGVARVGATAALVEARELAEEGGGALLAVRFDAGRTVEVLPHEPATEEGIEAASRRIASY